LPHGVERHAGKKVGKFPRNSFVPLTGGALSEVGGPGTVLKINYAPDINLEYCLADFVFCVLYFHPLSSRNILRMLSIKETINALSCMSELKIISCYN
jgi:hypothetical protein